MEAEDTAQKLRALSEEILLGMKEWRKQDPKATLRERDRRSEPADESLGRAADPGDSAEQPSHGLDG